MAPRTYPTDEADLFAPPEAGGMMTIAPDAVVLRRFVSTPPLRAIIERIATTAPFRRLKSPFGGQTSVAMTNCGAVGWHSDARGYRYVESDPVTGLPWSPLPSEFRELAGLASRAAGFGHYEPDCCLINRYAIGSQLGAHRDYDERDLGQPIVSVSIGLPATFLWYGATRKGPPLPVRVTDGDVVVFGGTARAGYHGVRRLAAGPATGPDAVRYNLTFRRAR